MLNYRIKEAGSEEVLGYIDCWMDEGSTGIGEQPSFYC